MTDTTAIEQRDEALPEPREEAVATALLSGRSVNAVRKEFGLSINEIDAIIARTWPVTPHARVRQVMLDLGKLDRLISEFYQRSLASEDAISAAYATVAIKAMERKHDLTGMSAASRIDLQVIRPPDQPTRHERIRKAIMDMVNQQPPAEREAHNLVGELGGERALELLRAGSANGDGAADALPPPDDADPNR
jgi:hypothetical protein